MAFNQHTPNFPTGKDRQTFNNCDKVPNTQKSVKVVHVQMR